jgi:hypothetical protein
MVSAAFSNCLEVEFIKIFYSSVSVVSEGSSKENSNKRQA